MKGISKKKRDGAGLKTEERLQQAFGKRKTHTAVNMGTGPISSQETRNRITAPRFRRLSGGWAETVSSDDTKHLTSGAPIHAGRSVQGAAPLGRGVGGAPAF